MYCTIYQRFIPAWTWWNLIKSWRDRIFSPQPLPLHSTLSSQGRSAATAASSYSICDLSYVSSAQTQTGGFISHSPIPPPSSPKAYLFNRSQGSRLALSIDRPSLYLYTYILSAIIIASDLFSPVPSNKPKHTMQP